MNRNFYTLFIEPALIYGSIVGVIYIVISVILSIANANFSVTRQVVDIALPVVGIIFCLIMYRKEYLGNHISYGRAFGMGVSMMLIMGILVAVYNYIYTAFINPDFFKEAQVVLEEKLINKNIDPRQIEFAIEKSAWVRTPFYSSLMAIVNFVVMGSIASLVIAAFVKKEDEDPFRDVI